MFQWLKKKPQPQQPSNTCTFYFTIPPEDMRRMAEAALKNMHKVIDEVGTTPEGVGLRIDETGFDRKTGFPTYNLCGPKELLDEALARMREREGFAESDKT